MGFFFSGRGVCLLGLRVWNKIFVSRGLFEKTVFKNFNIGNFFCLGAGRVGRSAREANLPKKKKKINISKQKELKIF